MSDDDEANKPADGACDGTKNLIDETSQKLVRNRDPKEWTRYVRSLQSADDRNALLASILDAMSPLFRPMSSLSTQCDVLLSDLDFQMCMEKYPNNTAEYPWQIMPTQVSTSLQLCLVRLLTELDDAELTQDHAKMSFVPIMQWIELRTCCVDHDLSTVGLELASLCELFTQRLLKFMTPQLITAQSDSVLQLLWTMQIMSPTSVNALSQQQLLVIKKYISSMHKCTSEDMDDDTKHKLAERKLVALLGWLDWNPNSAIAIKSHGLYCVLLEFASKFYLEASARALFHAEKCILVAVNVINLYGTNYDSTRDPREDLDGQMDARLQSTKFLDTLLFGTYFPMMDSDMILKEHAGDMLAVCAEIHTDEKLDKDGDLSRWKNAMVAKISLLDTQKVRDDLKCLAYFLGAPFEAPSDHVNR